MWVLQLQHARVVVCHHAPKMSAHQLPSHDCLAVHVCVDNLCSLCVCLYVCLVPGSCRACHRKAPRVMSPMLPPKMRQDWVLLPVTACCR